MPAHSTTSWALPFALAALRFFPALTLVPIFCGRALSLPLRFALALTLGLTLGPGSTVTLPHTDLFFLVAARELTVGLALALCLSTPFWALRHAGILFDTDPTNDSGPLAILYETAATLTLLGAGAHRAILRALSASWQLFPLQSSPTNTSTLITLAITSTASALSAGVSLASAALFASLAIELLQAVSKRFITTPVVTDNGFGSLARLTVATLALGASTGVARALMNSVLTALTPP